MIKNPPEVLIGFEYWPLSKFLIRSIIVLFKLSSFTQPIKPPVDAVSEVLCINAAFLKPFVQYLK